MGTGNLCESSGCALAKSGAGFTEVEVGSAYERTKLLIVGEASGEAEARESLPFRPYAQSGSLLSDALREVAVSRAEVAITNIVRCRPPKDWLSGAPYEYNAISNCIKNYLYETIDRLKPRAILALGGTAMRALTATVKGKYGTLDYARGYVQMGEGPARGIPVISTYHPAFIRRGAAHLTPLLQRDLRRAFLLATGRLVDGVHFACDVSRLGLNYQTAPAIDEAWAFAESIDPDLPLAFDIETPMSTRSDEDERTSFTDRDIKLVQFSQQRGHGIAFPFRDEFRDVVQRVLASCRVKVGFNNWSFDDPVLESNDIETGMTDDAMVMFGFLWSDLPKNLQAAAQFAGFPFPWKHYSDSDLAFYGCADADATLCVYNYCKQKMEEEGNWDSYRRYFAQVWPILRDMSRRGIPISNTKRLELKALIEREDLRVTAAIQGVVPLEVRSNKQKSGLKRTPKDTTGMVQTEVVIEKEEKCQCLKKEREGCPICVGSGIVPAGTVLKRWAMPTEFNPNSSQQVKRLIKFLKHPVPKHAKRTDESGDAAETTEMKELERLWQKTKHPVYPLLIEKRMLTKVDGTYVEGWTPSHDGSVHTTYTFQTATWQTSSRAPNVQNGLKHGKTEFQKQLASSFNGMQRAVTGRVLVNLDFKSFHALTTAHDFNIPDYARLARIDIHSFVTGYFLKTEDRERWWALSDADMSARFKELKKDETFKFCRDFKAKRAILGIQFGMGYRKLFQLNRDDFESESEARLVWEMVYQLFPALRKAQDEVRRKAAEDHRLVNKFGALRHFYDVQRWDRKQQKWVPGDQAEQAVAFLPASHAFGVMRTVLLALREKGWDERYGLCNQIHDSLVFHCPIELAEECVANVKGEMERPSSVLVYPEMAPQGLVVGADAAMGDSLADMKEIK